MKCVWFLFFLFSQSVLAGGEWRDFGKVSDEKDQESYLVRYTRPDGSSCFLDPRIFQTKDENADIVKLLDKHFCKFSEEEGIIQGILQNADASQSVIGLIPSPDGSYFSMPVEIIPVLGFNPAAMSGLVIAGGVVSTLPPGWVVIIALVLWQVSFDTIFHLFPSLL